MCSHKGKTVVDIRKSGETGHVLDDAGLTTVELSDGGAPAKRMAKPRGRPGAENHAFKHGHAIRGELSATWRSYHSMRTRCLNPGRNNYRIYGGRGITICERWLAGFENFLADMGERPPGTSLDRINSNGNYEPGDVARGRTWKNVKAPP